MREYHGLSVIDYAFYVLYAELVLFSEFLKRQPVHIPIVQDFTVSFVVNPFVDSIVDL